MSDPVNHPAHYKLFPGQEAIDIIRAALTPEEFRGYLKGNALKYRLRAGNKDDLQQDINKAEWYRLRLISEAAKAAAELVEWPEVADINGHIQP